MKNALNIGLGFLALAIVIVFSGTFYTLEEGEQAVIVQFGRPVGATVTEAGLHVKLPLIQEARRFEKRILIWDGDPNQIPTKGREFIWVDTTARWRIADAKKFLESVATEAGARSRLNDIIDSVVRDQVSGSDLVELVRSASWVVPKGEILEEVPAEVREELKKKVVRGREEITRTILAEARKVIPQYGIELVDVRIKRLDYVQSVREKVYTRMISGVSGSLPSSGPRAKAGAPRSWGPWRRSCARSAPPPTDGSRKSGESRRRGHARVRGSLWWRSRVLRLLANPGGIQGGAEQKLGGDPHDGQRLLPLPEAVREDGRSPADSLMP